MKKRILTALLAAVMLLTACSSGEDVDQNDKTSNGSKKDNSSDPEKSDSESYGFEPAKELGIWDIMPEIEITDADAFDYEYNSSLGGIVITDYLDKSPRVRIPDIIEGEPVVGVILENYEKELIEIVMPDTVKEFSFSESIQRSLKYMNVPGAAKSFDYSALSELSWSELIGIYISDGITEIDEEVFGPCTSLEKIFVDPQNPEYCSLDGILFTKNKTKLIAYPSGRSDTSYIIPDGVTGIGDYAFTFCASLAGVTVPVSVTEIGMFAFAGNESLETINVDPQNPEYCSVDGILFTKDKTDLIAYPAGKSDTSYTVPGGVTEIGNGAFACCTNLESVTIPDGVTEIGESTFVNCTNLKSVTIPNGITKIGTGTFRRCTSLTSMIIPDGVTRIYYVAFEGCTNLVVSYKGKIYDYDHINKLYEAVNSN